jgi:hypothetical protein
MNGKKNDALKLHIGRTCKKVVIASYIPIIILFQVRINTIVREILITWLK